MAKKTLNFRPDLNLFWPKFGPKKVFLWVLPLLEVKHCYKLSLYAISRETNKPEKKPISGPILALSAQTWVPKCFFEDFTFTRCQTLLQAIIACTFKENYCTKLEKMAENLVSGPNLGPYFFSLVLPLLEVRHCCKLSLYALSRKTIEPNLRKWQKTYFWT